MRETDNEQTMNRELSALFAATREPEEQDASRFVQDVMKRIRRRERTRFLVLSGSAVVLAGLAVPALVAFSSAFGGIDLNVLEEIRAALNQLAASASTYARSAAGTVTLATAAILAVTVVPLLRWLAD